MTYSFGFQSNFCQNKQKKNVYIFWRLFSIISVSGIWVTGTTWRQHNDDDDDNDDDDGDDDDDDDDDEDDDIWEWPADSYYMEARSLVKGAARMNRSQQCSCCILYFCIFYL